MSKLPTSEELLKNTQEFLENQGFSQDQDVEDKLEKLIEMLSKSRNTQGAFYGWEPPHGGGVARKLKNTIQTKLKNIILNTLEKYVMRQQKFNELTYQTILELKQENEQIKEQLAAQKDD